MVYEFYLTVYRDVDFFFHWFIQCHLELWRFLPLNYNIFKAKPKNSLRTFFSLIH